MDDGLDWGKKTSLRRETLSSILAGDLLDEQRAGVPQRSAASARHSSLRRIGEGDLEVSSPDALYRTTCTPRQPGVRVRRLS